jgi:hypothetical protein
LFLTLNEIKNTDHYDGIKHVANQGDPSDAGKIQKEWQTGNCGDTANGKDL